MMANTASLLPIIPRIFFLYLEPIMITYGASMQFAQFENIAKFADVLPVPALNLPGMAVQHLLNIMVYGLVVLLVGPPNKKLLVAHISILAFADFTHWISLFGTMAKTNPQGWAGAFDYKSWDPEVMQLATYPFQSLAFKVATLLGLFGKIKDSP